jgi:hypothetical protein
MRPKYRLNSLCKRWWIDLVQKVINTQDREKVRELYCFVAFVRSIDLPIISLCS